MKSTLEEDCVIGGPPVINSVILHFRVEVFNDIFYLQSINILCKIIVKTQSIIISTGQNMKNKNVSWKKSNNVDLRGKGKKRKDKLC